MRLKPRELDVIRHTLAAVDPQGRVWLFGSRTDDSRRGGDIDLYLEASRDISLETALQLEYQLLSRCGEKVDLPIRNPGQPEEPIHTLAKQGILL